MSIDRNIQIHNMKKMLKDIPEGHLKVYTFISLCSHYEEISVQDIKKNLNITKDEVTESILYLNENRLSNYILNGDKVVIGEGIKPDVLTVSTNQKQMFRMAERMLGKMLSPNEVTVLSGLYEMGLDAKIILFIIEYCVEMNKISIKYIEKVALSWYDMGVDTVLKAKKYKIALKEHAKFCEKVKNALEIHDRSLTAKEDRFVHKWKDSYGFDVDVIELAGRYTIENTSKRSFEYMDKILYSWYSLGVKNVCDAVKQKESFDDKKISKKSNIYTEDTKKTTFIPPKVWDFSKSG